MSGLPHLVPSIIYAAICVAACKSRHQILHTILVFPGVLLHEWAHFIASYLSFGKPDSIAFNQKTIGGRRVLGEVISKNIRWYNAAFIGLAPISLLLTIPWYLKKHQGNDVLLIDWLIAPALGSILVTAWPSSQDIKISLRSWPLFIAIFICALWQVSNRH